jgi:hypothetical protein
LVIPLRLSSSSGIVRYGGGTWSVVAAGNIILYQNDGFMRGVVDTTGIIIVGNELVCPDVSLPGSTAHVIVTLFTDDSFPEETSLGYQNLCNNIETTMLEYIDTSAEHRPVLNVLFHWSFLRDSTRFLLPTVLVTVS